MDEMSKPRLSGVLLTLLILTATPVSAGSMESSQTAGEAASALGTVKRLAGEWRGKNDKSEAVRLRYEPRIEVERVASARETASR